MFLFVTNFYFILLFFRFIELMDCCFSGADENTQTNGGNELIFPVYPVLPCRDTMQRSRTNSCDLLAQLPSSLSLGSGYLYILFIFAFLFTHSIIITNYHRYLDKRN
ncbi:unnamed protein product [Prunus armeniaca]